MLDYHGFSSTSPPSSRHNMEQKLSVIFLSKLFLIASLLSNEIVHCAGQNFIAKKPDEADALLPNLIRVIKRSLTEEEYPGVPTNDNEIVEAPWGTNDEPEAGQPWFRDFYRTFSKRGSGSLTYRMIKRGGNILEDQEHRDDDTAYADYGLAPLHPWIKAFPWNQHTWKRGNQWGAKRNQANIFRLIKRSV